MVSKAIVQGIQSSLYHLCKSTKKSDETKPMAIKMYFEGLVFRAIGKLLDVSQQTLIDGLDKQVNNIKSEKIRFKIRHYPARFKRKTKCYSILNSTQTIKITKPKNIKTTLDLGTGKVTIIGITQIFCVQKYG